MDARGQMDGTRAVSGPCEVWEGLVGRNGPGERGRTVEQSNRKPTPLQRPLPVTPAGDQSHSHAGQHDA